MLPDLRSDNPRWPKASQNGMSSVVTELSSLFEIFFFNAHGAIVMTTAIVRAHPVQLISAVPNGHQPRTTWTESLNLSEGCCYENLSFIIITQIESYIKHYKCST